MTIRKILMTDLEEAQRAKIERLYGEIEKWKTKYFEQIKTDEEWERYIKKSREEAEEQRKRDLNYVVLGITLFFIGFLIN